MHSIPVLVCWAAIAVVLAKYWRVFLHVYTSCTAADNLVCCVAPQQDDDDDDEGDEDYVSVHCNNVQ